MKKSIFFLLAALLLSCHSEKKAASPAQTSSTQQASNGDAVKALNNLVVSFYSRGSGINTKASMELEEFIIKYSHDTNTEIGYKKTPWGREGEVDFCIELSKMQPGQRDKFLIRVKEILKIASLVHIYENHPCRDSK